jgi:hypothetical protein
VADDVGRNIDSSTTQSIDLNFGSSSRLFLPFARASVDICCPPVDGVFDRPVGTVPCIGLLSSPILFTSEADHLRVQHVNFGMRFQLRTFRSGIFSVHGRHRLERMGNRTDEVGYRPLSRVNKAKSRHSTMQTCSHYSILLLCAYG